MAKKNSVEIVLSAKDQASGQVRQAFGSLQSSASTAMAAAGRAIATAATAAVALTGVVAKVGIEYNSMAENSQVAWETLLGTQDQAKKMLSDIAQFAKKTQFDTTSVDMMAKYMHNAGLEGKALFEELTQVADVAGAFNISAAEAQELARQMSQVRQAGVAYTEDLNVLQDRGVPIYKAISEQLGITVADVRKMASEGKISADIYNQAFDSIATSVAGSSEKQSKTFTGMMSTLKDNLNMISGELTKGAFEKLKSALETAMPYVEQFSSTLKDEGLKSALGEIFGEEKVQNMTNLFNTIKDIGVAAFNGLKDAVKFVSDNMNILTPIVTGLTAAVLAQMAINGLVSLYKTWQAATVAQTTAQWLLNIALNANPIGLVAMAIGILVAAGIALYKNWDTVKAKAQEVWEKLGPFQNVIKGLAGPFGWLIDLGVKLYKNWDDLIAKAKDLANKIKGFFTGLSNIKIPLPHFNLTTDSKTLMGKKITYPTGFDVDWYDKGGVFYGPQVIGVGEKRPEFVGALDDLKNIVQSAMGDTIASAVGTAVMQAMQYSKPSGTGGDILLNIDGRTFARIIKPYSELEDKRVGTNVRLQSI